MASQGELMTEKDTKQRYSSAKIKPPTQEGSLCFIETKQRQTQKSRSGLPQRPQSGSKR
jgi:hypothetical protein